MPPYGVGTIVVSLTTLGVSISSVDMPCSSEMSMNKGKRSLTAAIIRVWGEKSPLFLRAVPCPVLSCRPFCPAFRLSSARVHAVLLMCHSSCLLALAPLVLLHLLLCKYKKHLHAALSYCICISCTYCISCIALTSAVLKVFQQADGSRTSWSHLNKRRASNHIQDLNSHRCCTCTSCHVSPADS